MQRAQWATARVRDIDTAPINNVDDDDKDGGKYRNIHLAAQQQTFCGHWQ